MNTNKVIFLFCLHFNDASAFCLSIRLLHIKESSDIFEYELLHILKLLRLKVRSYVCSKSRSLLSTMHTENRII